MDTTIPSGPMGVQQLLIPTVPLANTMFSGREVEILWVERVGILVVLCGFKILFDLHLQFTNIDVMYTDSYLRWFVGPLLIVGHIAQMEIVTFLYMVGLHHLLLNTILSRILVPIIQALELLWRVLLLVMELHVRVISVSRTSMPFTPTISNSPQTPNLDLSSYTSPFLITNIPLSQTTYTKPSG